MATNRQTPIDISKAEFRKVGYQLIDSISDFLDTIDERPVTTGESPKQLQALLCNSALPETGRPVNKLLTTTAELMFNHSLLTGHPEFLMYITSSPIYQAR